MNKLEKNGTERGEKEVVTIAVSHVGMIIRRIVDIGNIVVSLSLGPSSLLLVVILRDSAGYPPEMDGAMRGGQVQCHLDSVPGCTEAEGASLACADSPTSAVASRDGRGWRFASPPC